MVKSKLTDKELADMSPWDIAERLGIDYSGDMNPIPHGGYFYDTRDWEAWGYASCVEFWYDDDNDRLVVQRGTINRLDDSMADAFLCCGIPDDERDNIHAQIEACKGHMGSEQTEDMSVKTFNLDNWPKEWRIWKSVRGWIEALGE